MFRVSLRSFGAFLIFSNLVSRERLVVERNGPKCGPRVGGRQVVTVYRIPLTYKKCLRSFWCRSAHFLFSTTLYLENGWPYSETDHSLFSLQMASMVIPYCIQDILHCQMFKVSLRSFGAFSTGLHSHARYMAVRHNSKLLPSGK